jgi:predicted nucleotidyltransferase
MKFGLKAQDLEYIIKTIAEFQEIEKAAIFGSRAKGTYKPGSDIDIALFGESVSFNTISKLHAILEEESPMPYFFDIFDYNHSDSNDLKAHVDRVGITIYEKSGTIPSK